MIAVAIIVIVFANGERYDLKPLSYIVVSNNGLKMYDKKADTYTVIDNVEGSVVAYTDEYSVDLSNDTFTYKDRYYLLIKGVE